MGILFSLTLFTHIECLTCEMLIDLIEMNRVNFPCFATAHLSAFSSRFVKKKIMSIQFSRKKVKHFEYHLIFDAMKGESLTVCIMALNVINASDTFFLIFFTSSIYSPGNCLKLQVHPYE